MYALVFLSTEGEELSNIRNCLAPFAINKRLRQIRGGWRDVLKNKVNFR